VPLSELSSSSRRSAAEPGTGSDGRGLAVGPLPTVIRDDSVTVTRAAGATGSAVRWLRRRTTRTP
jgi:hypothetical protein